MSRMSTSQFEILAALAHGPLHGYAIMERVASLHGAKRKMGPATLYTTLQKLLQDKWIAETASAGQDPRRRTYLITQGGSAQLAQEWKAQSEFLDRARPPVQGEFV